MSARGMVGLVVVLILFLASACGLEPIGPESPPGVVAPVSPPAAADWELVGPPGVVQLYTPAGDVRYAATRTALFRSSDGGAVWSAVPLPPPPPGSGRFFTAVD